MRWIVAVLGLVLTGTVHAGFSPRYPTDFPCASDERPVQAYEMQLRSTQDFLDAYRKTPCALDAMVETLYVYAGKDVPDTASMFDARINAPLNTLKTTEQSYTQDPSIEKGVAYGWDLLRNKRYTQTIEVLEPLYETARAQQSLHQDTIAKQLVYAYELSGSIAQALEWAQIRYSLTKSRAAALHIDILRTQQSEGLKWFSTHSVLNLPFDDGFNVPNIDLNIHNEKVSLRQSVDTLATFLYERVELYPHNDPVSASALSDLGYLVALTGAFEDAQYVFGLAQLYGNTNAAAVQRSFEFREMGRHWVDWLLFVIEGLGLVVGTMVFALVYRWCLRFRAAKTGSKSWIGTLILGVVLSVGVFGVLLALAGWMLLISSVSGQAPSSWELVLFLTVVGCVVGGMVVGWMNVLHQEIVAVGVKRYWVNMGLGVVWILGWMIASVLTALSPHSPQLMLNELLPIILMMPVVAGFVLWVKRLRAQRLAQEVV